MSQNNLVPCFYAGSLRTGTPDFEKERTELRLWMKEGRGYFVDHGTRFQMAATIAPQERGISSSAAAVTFSHVQDKLQKPHAVSYPIPAVADHRLRWMNSFMNMPNEAQC